MEYQWNIGIQNYKNEKKSRVVFHIDLFSVFYCYLLQFICLKISYLNNLKQLFLKIIAPIVIKFHIKHDQTLGF